MQQPSADSRHNTWTLLRSLAMGDDISRSIAALVGTSRDHLVTAAVAQGMDAALAAAFTAADLALPPALRDGQENARFLRAASRDVLGHIASVFETERVVWAVLKGPVLASFYADPARRSYKDLDILVRGSDLERAIDALTAAGIDDINSNWLNYRTYGVAETPLWAPGVAIDLHWHLVALARRRGEISIDIGQMLNRVRLLDIDGLALPALSAEDQLLHVTLHAALGGTKRLVWLLDIRQLLRSETIDWDRFVAQTLASRFAPQIGQCLDRARVVLGAQVPETVCRSLCPQLLLAGRRTVDRRNRGAGLPDRFLRGFLVEASGRSVGHTIARTAAALRKRVRPQHDWNVGSADGPLYWNLATGGPDARQAYLDYARTHG